MDPISSRANPVIVSASRLGRNRPEGVCLVEGPVACQDAVVGGAIFDRIFVVEGDVRGIAIAGSAGLAPTMVTPGVLAKVATTDSPQSPIAIVRIADSDLEQDEPVLVLWELADPGNVGTLIRTAAAFGLQVLVVGGADPWASKCMRSASGGHFRTPVIRADVMRAHDLLAPWDWFASVPRGGDAPSVLGGSGSPAIMIGNETHGLPAAVVEAAHLVSIPMVDTTESLNAAQAGAVLMWEWSRITAG